MYNITNGKQGNDGNVICGYYPTVDENKSRMLYYSETACPYEIKKSTLNWLFSAINCAIDGAGKIVGAPGVCTDVCILFESMKRIAEPCFRSIRNLTTSPINADTYLVIQDCPSGEAQRVKVSDIVPTSMLPCNAPAYTGTILISDKLYGCFGGTNSTITIAQLIALLPVAVGVGVGGGVGDSGVNVASVGVGVAGVGDAAVGAVGVDGAPVG